MTIGERIKQRRIFLGLSADDLAGKLGKNRATIYRYESNFIEKMPTSIIQPLAEALQTTPAYLMGWQDEDNNIVKKNDAIADIILKLRTDDDFLKVVEGIKELSPEQLTAVKTFLSAFNI